MNQSYMTMSAITSISLTPPPLSLSPPQTGTGVYLEALPPPPQLSFHSKEGGEKSSTAVSSIQAEVDTALNVNRKVYGLLQAPTVSMWSSHDHHMILLLLLPVLQEV